MAEQAGPKVCAAAPIADEDGAIAALEDGAIGELEDVAIGAFEEVPVEVVDEPHAVRPAPSVSAAAARAAGRCRAVMFMELPFPWWSVRRCSQRQPARMGRRGVRGRCLDRC